MVGVTVKTKTSATNRKDNMIHNVNCDGNKCATESGEVRVLPLGHDPNHGNLILCHDCYLNEIRFRVSRNRDLADSCKFDLPRWDDLDWRHPASGLTLRQSVMQPHVSTFSEAFSAWAPYVSADPRFPLIWMNGEKAKGRKAERMAVSAYCLRRSDGGHLDSLNVRPADWVLSRIREGMILVPNDRLHFEIVDHGNGWSLLVVNHGQILGSRWLAYIKTNSIPQTGEVTA